MSINRGKESIALDLKAPADRTIFEAIVARRCSDRELSRRHHGKIGFGWDSLKGDIRN